MLFSCLLSSYLFLIIIYITITLATSNLNHDQSFLNDLQLINHHDENEEMFITNMNSDLNPDTLNGLFISEFEIIEMSNHDGRLQNGHCCNGQRPNSSGACKGGNTTCLPYWRVCITELSPDYHPHSLISQPSNSVILMADGREMSSSSMNVTSTPSTTTTTTTTTKKPSFISNWFSKIFGNHKSSTNRDHLTTIMENRNKHIKNIIQHMSPSSCQIGFWSSAAIQPDTIFPIELRKLVQLKTPVPVASGPSIRPPNAIISNRNFVSIVEIWSKNSRNDVKNRLISRQINHYNIEASSLFKSSNNASGEPDWLYGGKVFNPLINALLGSTVPGHLDHRHRSKLSNKAQSSTQTSCKQRSSATNSFRYRYRWRLKSLKSMISDGGVEGGITMKELNRLNLTSEGCPQGYQGQPDCNEPVCLEGCHPDHGYCEQPGQCSCRFGWTGMFCDYCLTLPGCIHGTCTRPLECRCEDGWTGMFCSIPKCREGCHASNGYCTKPDECKCKFGWQGVNCTECSPLPGCQHGHCEEPLDCQCESGWQGTFCSNPICRPGCQNGWCEKPGECRCNLGYKGDNCTECVPYPGCQHGHCLDDDHPWTCQCQPGYGGFLCDQLLNWCETNVYNNKTSQMNITNTTMIPEGLIENPCQNGGTCISVEREHGNYKCKCPMGYTGKHCQTIAT